MSALASLPRTSVTRHPLLVLLLIVVFAVSAIVAGSVKVGVRAVHGARSLPRFR